MMPQLHRMVEQIRLMSFRQKAVLLSVAVLSFASFIFFFLWFQGADYQALYGNLSEEDAGMIIQKLKEQKVPYKVVGSVISVPADKVYDLRLTLASQGLPQGGAAGFELFDKTSFSTTDFVQKLNYRRALQGELGRTIKSLSEVEQCRVHLAVPERSLFMREEDRPKASVLVKLKPGRKLTQGQVQGIVHLVSSSVEGLSPKDVAVVDNQGEMLTSARDDSTGLTSSQMEYQRALEKDIETRVISILDPVVGKEKVRAKVAAMIDFSRVEKTEERFDPDSQVVRSELRNNERTTNGSTSGVPGVASNLPGKTLAQGGSSQGQSERKNETINYEISKVTSHVVHHPGEIRRLTVAVLVDGTVTGSAGSKERQYKPRSEEDLKNFEEMVKKAIGFSSERGDEVRVVNMPFEGVVQDDLAAPKTEILPIVLTIMKYLVPLLAVVLLWALLLKPMLKIAAAPRSGAETSLSLPQTIAELERVMELPDMSSRARVLEWAKKHPKEAAHLIKGWIKEEQ